MFFRTRVLRKLLTIVVTLFASQINAATTLTFNEFGAITGISGIEVLGQTWDATFNSGSADTVYASETLFTEPEAFDAQLALRAELEALAWSYQPTDLYGCANPPGCYIQTVYDISGGRAYSYSTLFDTSSPYSFNAATSTASIDYGNVIYTTWTVVPVPAAVWLFCSGLFGLIGVARRKKCSN